MRGNSFFSGSPVIVFQFDDAYEDIIDTAYPILAAAGYPATTYAVTGQVGAAGRMTLEELTALYNAGWDVSNHTTDHTTLTTLSLEDQTTKIGDAQSQLDTWGFTRSSHHLAFPGGASDTNTQLALSSLNVTSGRGGYSDPLYFPVANPRKIIGGLYTLEDIDIDTMKAVINNITDPNRIAMLATHHVTEEAVPWGVSTAYFQELVNFVASKNLPVRTITGVI